MRFATVPAAFTTAATTDPARPMITWYDDGTGERAELSGATCANWACKTANLLVEGCGLEHDDVAVVDLPPHWQTAMVLCACWSAGLRVGEPPATGPVVFAAADRAAGHRAPGADVYGLALAPLAAPMRSAPDGVADFVTEVRPHGDHFQPPAPVRPTDTAVTLPHRELSHEELCRTAVERATSLGIPADGRVLIDVDKFPDMLDWLLAPLLVGASTVLCTRMDESTLAARAATERVDVSVTRQR